MRAMLCGCGKRLEAVDNDGLVRETVEHYRWLHGMALVDGEGIRRIVEGSSYGSEGDTAAYAVCKDEDPRSCHMSGERDAPAHAPEDYRHERRRPEQIVRSRTLPG